jgi:hypothetical protein
MRPCRKRLSLTLLAGSIGVACSVALLAVALAQEAGPLPPPVVAEPKPQPPAAPQCKVDLRDPITMANIISNVLTRAEVIPEPGPEDETFREDAKKRYATGDEVLKAAAEHFKIDQKRLAALVEHWRHINCWHPAIPGFVVPDPIRNATQCKVDLRRPVTMANIISNVLTRAEGIPESEDALFREDAKKRYATGDEVLKAAAEHFKIDQKRLAALVEHWRHINCKHVAIPGYAVPDADRSRRARQ